VATPEQPGAGGTPPPPPTQRGYGLAPGAVARMPIPGNAEFVVYFLVELVFAIIWAASDSVDANLFVTISGVVTFGYLVSRGIAKASRVLEQ
jgi:hypothetical protein